MPPSSASQSLASHQAPRPRPRTKAARRALGLEVYRRLGETFPDAHCELDFTSPFELLVATVLSAQTTDKLVNTVTPALFARYPDAAALAAARPEDVEEILRPTGYFRQKTRSAIGIGVLLTSAHGGEVPRTMAELTALPGVGRKTANVVLGNAFSVPGLPVDTHVTRVSGRLGLTTSRDPLVIEKDLTALLPPEIWTMTSHRLIFLGRRICHARKPSCGTCPLADLCPSGP